MVSKAGETRPARVHAQAAKLRALPINVSQKGMS
jgi:hypothetical protein